MGFLLLFLTAALNIGLILGTYEFTIKVTLIIYMRGTEMNVDIWAQLSGKCYFNA